MRTLLTSVLLISISYVVIWAEVEAEEASRRKLPELTVPLLVTQVDVADAGRSRLVLVRGDGSVKVLTGDLFSARDGEVSFDGTRILFSGRERAEDRWAVYEMNADGSKRRKIVSINGGDCRAPRYLSTLYTIVSDKPWYQIVFVGEGVRGAGGGADLYSCKLDGSELSRLTYNLARNSSPYLMHDGRLLFGVQHPGTHGSIFGINIDGTDYATFLGNQGRTLNRMPCETTRGLVVFVESDKVSEDGSGTLSAVHIRRPLHTYRAITKPDEGRFHSPAPGPAGSLLVSRRSTSGGDTFGVVLLDPASRKVRAVFDDRDHHDLQAQQVAPRPEPDGRSSVVTAKDPYGELYCLNVGISDDEPFAAAVKKQIVRTVRVFEGFPGGADGTNLPIAHKWLLGEVPLADDGSFSLKVPANTPVQIQLLDEQGTVTKSCRWIWARNHEPRGCIGCHEDGELTPENWFVDALKEPSTLLREAESDPCAQGLDHANGDSE